LQFERGQTNTPLMTVGGAIIVDSKHQHHHFPFSYTPIQTSHVGKLQMRCLVSGTGVTKSNSNNFTNFYYSEAQNPATEVKMLTSSSEAHFPQTLN